MFSFHIFFHVFPWGCTNECSAQFGSYRHRETWYAVRIVKVWALFSIHTNLSCVVWWFKGIVSMVSQVCLSNVEKSFPLSHCLDSSFIKSWTVIFTGGALINTGEWGSQLWVTTRIFLSSPISYWKPAYMISLAASKECHSKEGLFPNSASKKKVLGKYLAL